MWLSLMAFIFFYFYYRTFSLSVGKTFIFSGIVNSCISSELFDSIFFCFNSYLIVLFYDVWARVILKKSNGTVVFRSFSSSNFTTYLFCKLLKSPVSIIFSSDSCDAEITFSIIQGNHIPFSGQTLLHLAPTKTSLGLIEFKTVMNFLGNYFACLLIPIHAISIVWLDSSTSWISAAYHVLSSKWNASQMCPVCFYLSNCCLWFMINFNSFCLFIILSFNSVLIYSNSFL